MTPPAGKRVAGEANILHLDMDCFFAAVEMLDDPSLAGTSVIVGGLGSRGVVASASYEARAYGVRSAMPMVTARRICPHATFLAPRGGRYGEVSRSLMELLRTVTPLVEPVSLDEAYLDVAGAHALFGDSVAIAATLRERVAEQLSLACCVGIGTTKLIAKLASRDAKPRLRDGVVSPGAGIVVVSPEDEAAYLGRQLVGSLPGVGSRTREVLAHLGVETVGELGALERSSLVRRLGSQRAASLLDLARGLDPRAVVPDRAVRSIGHEQTFEHDVHDRDVVAGAVHEQARTVARRCRDQGVVARTVTLKVRHGDFSGHTRSSTAASPLRTSAAIASVALELLASVEFDPGIRLVGVSVSNLEAAHQPEVEQLELFSSAGGSVDVRRRDARVDAATDEIQRRFGAGAITHANWPPAQG